MFRYCVALLAAGHIALGARKNIAKHAKGASSLPLDQALFLSAHNSYEKKPLGVVQSLDFGFRMVEFDIFLHSFESTKEYCIGHDYCGDPDTQDGEKGNPDTHYLNAWLWQIRSWSLSHPGHAPLTVMFDMKDNLASGAKTFAQGGLSNLQDVMQTIFGDSLYWASSKPAGHWPSVDSLRDKVMVVLSGDRTSRIFYQQDEGRNPRVAINEAGLVVEAHQNSNGDAIYYWTGRAEGYDAVTWSRHGRIDSGRDVWVAIGDDNTVVEVHRSASMWSGNTLWYRIGSLDAATLEMSWGPSEQYDTGASPTCRILGNGQLEERHKSENTGKVWVRNGTIDVAGKKINWHSGAMQQDLSLFDPRAASLSGSRSAEVREQGGLVEARLDAQQAFQKIHYPQLFFVDWQPHCSGNEENYAPLNDSPFLGVTRKCGSIPVFANVATRVWAFSMRNASSGMNPGAFPATDELGDEYKEWVLSHPNAIEY